jgi:hypothetical protein
MPGCGVDECQPPVSFGAAFVDKQALDCFPEHRFHRITAQTLDPHMNILITRQCTTRCPIIFHQMSPRA